MNCYFNSGLMSEFQQEIAPGTKVQEESSLRSYFNVSAGAGAFCSTPFGRTAERTGGTALLDDKG